VGTTIQQRPTITPENKLNKKKKNSSRLDWDIDMNRTKAKAQLKEKNHQQLQPTSRSPHCTAKTPDDKDVKTKMRHHRLHCHHR